jgi:putative lipoic acid-binding regulatory protein
MMGTVDDPYERFKALLNKELQFPAHYLHKFIGPNSPEFRESVAEFEKKFIGLKRTGEKTSSSNVHVSLTYEYLAANADEIVNLTVETKNIPGVLYIL